MSASMELETARRDSANTARSLIPSSVLRFAAVLVLVSATTVSAEGPSDVTPMLVVEFDRCDRPARETIWRTRASFERASAIVDSVVASVDSAGALHTTWFTALEPGSRILETVGRWDPDGVTASDKYGPVIGSYMKDCVVYPDGTIDEMRLHLSGEHGPLGGEYYARLVVRIYSDMVKRDGNRTSVGRALVPQPEETVKLVDLHGSRNERGLREIEVVACFSVPDTLGIGEIPD